MNTIATLQAQPEDGTLLSVRALAEAVACTLRTARDVAEQRRPIDLHSLQSDMELLCTRALDLPAEQRSVIRADLLALLGELDSLSAAIQPRAGPAAQG